MDEDQSAEIPASFLALYTGARQRLLEPAAVVRRRHDLCEDLAQQIVPAAQGLMHDNRLAEEDVLARLHGALAAPEAGLRDGEAGWVVTRAAELLGWTLPPAGCFSAAPTR